jgi:DNA-binding NtrC family response regulator
MGGGSVRPDGSAAGSKGMGHCDTGTNVVCRLATSETFCLAWPSKSDANPSPIRWHISRFRPRSMPSSRSSLSSAGLASRPTVLAVDDDEETLEILGGQLERAGYSMLGCSSAEGALREPRLQDVDVIVSDVHLGGMDGIWLCERLTTRCPEVPVVVVTAFADSATERAAFEAGAFDFVPKPVHTGPQFLRAIKRALEHRKRERQVEYLERLVSALASTDALETNLSKRFNTESNDAISSHAPVSIIGGSPGMRYAVARAIHDSSGLRERPLITLNCGTAPVELLGEELFDAETSPQTNQRFGSIFLDDIDRLSPSLQQKLLSSLVGTDDMNPVKDASKFRILAGSAMGLDQLVNTGCFSSELYSRLKERCIGISMPRINNSIQDLE